MNTKLKILSDNELNNISGGYTETKTTSVNQYDVKPGCIYQVYFPMQHGPFIKNEYGSKSGSDAKIAVYEVFEAPGTFFGTNRSVKGIDIDTGEEITVRINSGNIWTIPGEQY